MNYYEFTFTYTSPIDIITLNDILAAELGTIGFESFSELEDGMNAYIPANVFDAEQLKIILNNFPLDNVEIQYNQQLIEGKDWNEEWEKNYFQPIRIDQKCLIRASFHPEEKGFEHEIIINPKMAFGTGNHETTFLMLREMLSLDLQDKELLDMGCGTAVLAILAAKKGAKRIVAIDIDEWAYNNAIENCVLNGAEIIQVILGGAEQIANTGIFDYIFANINRNILLNDMQSYTSVLKPGGILYMSGFYKEDIPAIETECNRNGLLVISHTECNNWVALKTKKNVS
ncbi:MAG: 50S ribosomal protein L11 methyltransferase [Tannerella sp.]|jgi:ribosomal protein L11 methyltransferase|nr:50S ribosomal protein L11 methyltransferase [Tannerella sp.]